MSKSSSDVDRGGGVVSCVTGSSSSIMIPERISEISSMEGHGDDSVRAVAFGSGGGSDVLRGMAWAPEVSFGNGRAPEGCFGSGRAPDGSFGSGGGSDG